MDIFPIIARLKKKSRNNVQNHPAIAGIKNITANLREDRGGMVRQSGGKTRDAVGVMSLDERANQAASKLIYRPINSTEWFM